MDTVTHDVGELFPVQFVWRLPDEGFLRAVFEAEVTAVVPAAEKYIVRLQKLLAGRQELANGEMLPTESLTREYWAMVGQLVGRRLTVAFEAGDGRPLNMRFATLTGEHNFFYRFPD